MSQAASTSTNSSPSASAPSSPPSSPRLQNSEAKQGRNLILFFDGTGNAFTGSNADTNVVKLLHKLERNDPNQFHYYQTGIGTYDVTSTIVDKNWIASIRSSISQTLDQGFGTGFDEHVMAGYRFLMRYYESGDKIYMFGFSRGAFTAKFLARMIHTVGLLCKGNEEMVSFAYRLYQRYITGQIKEFRDQHRHGGRRDTIYDAECPDTTKKASTKNDEITIFSNTFCRKERVLNKKNQWEEQNIKVYFLGMWDCVNSVAVLERTVAMPSSLRGTATFVRHAVSVDERRVKFKAALLAQDIRESNEDNDEDIKEIWFPGCHGDVGGGWPATTTNWKDLSLSQRLRNVWNSRKTAKDARDIDSGPMQMSDIPLAWMIHELEQAGAGIKWRHSLVDDFRGRLHRHMNQALRGPIHDSLHPGHGTGLPKVLGWNLLEYVPFISRWELEGNKWIKKHFSMNKGSPRDIPPDAVLHESLIWRLRNDTDYRPRNNHGGEDSPCLGQTVEFEALDGTPTCTAKSGADVTVQDMELHHRVYKFKSGPKEQA